MILLVGLEVLGEVGDPLGEDGNLDFRRTGVASWVAFWRMTSCFSSLRIMLGITFHVKFALISGTGG